MAFQIVTDSACNLTEEMIDQFGLEVLPLTFMIDGVQHRSYLKGQKTDLKQFYTMMREGKVITTSLPNMQESESTLRAIAEAGKDILYLGFSSALSGTYEATDLLLKQMAPDFPDRTFISEETPFLKNWINKTFLPLPAARTARPTAAVVLPFPFPQ